MNHRAFRCTPILLVALALLLALPGLGAAAERPGTAARARAAFEAVAPPQAASCGICAIAFQRCSTACFGRGDKTGMGACLTGCDNLAATCTCDQQGGVNLRSEDLVRWDPSSMTKDACHGYLSCQPNYPSCASWSGYSSCGDPFCGTGHRCGDDCEPWGPCPGDAWKEFLERFRVCFDQYGNSCTEWQTTQTSSCGC